MEEQISQPLPTTNSTICRRRLYEKETARKDLEEHKRLLSDAEERLDSINRTYNALIMEVDALKNTIVKAYLKGGKANEEV